MWEIFFFKNDAENDEERLVSDHFVCVLNEFIWVKNKFSAPYFPIYFNSPPLGHTMKTNYISF